MVSPSFQYIEKNTIKQKTVLRKYHHSPSIWPTIQGKETVIPQPKRVCTVHHKAQNWDGSYCPE